MLQTLLHDKDSFQCYRLSFTLQIPSNATNTLSPYRFLPVLYSLSSNVQIPSRAAGSLPHCSNFYRLSSTGKISQCNRLSSTLQVPSNATALLLLYKFLPCYRHSYYCTDSFHAIDCPYKTADTPQYSLICCWLGNAKTPVNCAEYFQCYKTPFLCTDFLLRYSFSSTVRITSNATNSPLTYRFLMLQYKLSYNVLIYSQATNSLPTVCTNSFLCLRHSFKIFLQTLLQLTDYYKN